MKALVYHGPGLRSWDEVPDPVLQDPGDVIVRITSSTICGTDLHILKGDVPEVTPGTILGHEAVGIITEAGKGVQGRQAGAGLFERVSRARGGARGISEERQSLIKAIRVAQHLGPGPARAPGPTAARSCTRRSRRRS